MQHRSLTRSLTAGLAVGAILFTAGCSAGTGANEESDRKSVTIMGYAALFEDKYTEAVLEKYRADNPDVDVKFLPKGNSAEMLGALRSEKGNPSADLIIMDTSVANGAIKEGLLAPMPASDVPNVANVLPLGQQPEGYGPALTFDSLSLVYNPTTVTAPPTSWDALWEAGPKSSAIDAPPDIQGIALTAIVAESLGLDHQKDIAPAIDRLAELAPKVQTWEPQPDVYQIVMDGTVDYGVAWNARAQVFAAESEGTLAVAELTDSTAFQINTINLVADSKNMDAARHFANYALSPEAQQSFAETMFYAPTVQGVTLDADTATKVVSEDDPTIDIDWVWMADNRDAWTDLWRRGVIKG